jgi:glucose-6-phosphate dehydrogenase assembly protein OpcA
VATIVDVDLMAATETYSLGQEVEIGKIDKELKKLWAESEGAMTRASLMNLAVYSEEPGSLPQNTKLISELTEDHACRAIVIGADRSAKENRVEAWISAHCHVSRAGSKQICSEQISFLLAGEDVDLLPNIVFSHLDSDLPFYLWWQSELPNELDPQFWARVDRFVYDSQTWRDFAAQLRRVETAQRAAKQRMVLCDLNWTRLDKLRAAIAQFFDHPASHHHFSEMKSVNVSFAPGFKSTAIFLIGWLAAQLNWKTNQQTMNGHCRFLDPNNRKIDIELREGAGAPVSEVRLESSSVEFVVRQASCGDLLEVWRSAPNERPTPQMLPAQSNEVVDLLSQELRRGGQHRVYVRAVESIRNFF